MPGTSDGSGAQRSLPMSQTGRPSGQNTLSRQRSVGGGQVMVKEGLFTKFPADEVYALHNWPGLPAGSSPLPLNTTRFA